MQKKKKGKKKDPFSAEWTNVRAARPALNRQLSACCAIVLLFSENDSSPRQCFFVLFLSSFSLVLSLSSFFLPASRLILASTNSILFPWPFWRAGCPLLVCKCHVEKAETARSSTTESRKLILCTRALEKEETRRRRRKRRSRGKRWMRLW